MVLAATLLAHAASASTPDQIIPFKQTVNSTGGAVTLNLHVFTPEGHQASDSRPAVVFFFGGGWVGGSPDQFYPHCGYLASRGIVAISAEYRIRNTHGTSPQECVKDGKSAIRYVRENAATLGIDPNQIVAGGGSAGGHVAAAAGTLAGYEEPGENLAISSRPDALVLFNPVYDNGPGGYGHNTVKAYWEDISPLHNISATIPPAIVFFGTADTLVPVATAKNFKALMEAEGIRSDLHLYQDQPHSFFNFAPSSGGEIRHGYRATVFAMDEFLVSLGYLDGPHDAPVPATGWATIFGDAGFSASSETSDSPVTTDATADAIAAAIPQVNLADGDFIRLSGSVSVNAPLTNANFRIGLFNGTQPVTPGNGSGYVGIWAEAPATVDTKIAAGNGSSANHPFETAAGSTLGPIPAASATVSANTPVAFTLMISRNGNSLDLTARFSDGGSYEQEQNLLNQAVSSFDYNRVAFLMTGNLNATQAAFSNIGITTGRVLADPIAEPPRGGFTGTIHYIDAVDGSGGNTFKTGSTPGDTSWVGPSSSATNNTQWSKRAGLEGNGDTVFQAMPNGSPAGIPELTTRLTGLADGEFDMFAFYWDQVESDTQNWVLAAGLNSGELTTYSSPGEPAVTGATTANVTNAADLTFANPAPAVVAGGGIRNLFGVKLGTVTVSGGAPVDVFIDMLIDGNSSNTRTWYDGVGYSRINSFSNWIMGFDVGGQTAIGDDPDKDGIPNGIENFFGTDPVLADGTGLRAVAVDSTGASFTHPQNSTPAADLVATYQWSDNLMDFHDSGVPNSAGTIMTMTPHRDVPSFGITTVEATVSGTPLSDRMFVRIKISQNNP